MIESFKASQKASRTTLSIEKRNEVLKKLIENLQSNKEEILAANAKDLAKMDKESPLYDRLLLDSGRIDAICGDIENVISLPDPTNQTIEQRTLENGLDLSRIKVPLGVVGVIYEARPNVTIDVFTLCFKSGNACVLKGGSDAEFSNLALVETIKQSLKDTELSENYVFLMPKEREHVETLLKADKYIDLIIPRGSQGLIKFVKENSLVPIIETGAGIVHTYIDEECAIDKAAEIIFNAKTQRPSVCNALDCLVIHEKQLENLPKLTEKLTEKEVEIFADETSHEAIAQTYPQNLLNKATEEDYGREFLSLKMSIKTVKKLDEAIEHINQYSSRHSEAILSTNLQNQEEFINRIDAGAIYTNTSTRFTDGAVFGLGAEIGISTQKLHARGPFALDALTTYKWVLRGDGEVR